MSVSRDSIGEWDEIGGLLDGDLVAVPGWNVIALTAGSFPALNRSADDFTVATFHKEKP